MSTTIGAKRDRVWRAITDPVEIVAWNERILGRIDPGTAYPCTGQRVRWRYRLGDVQLVLTETPQCVLPGERLQTALAAGSLRFEQTYTLAESESDEASTRVGIKIRTKNSIPVMGEVVDRFAVRQMVSDQVDTSLRWLRKWCENNA